MRVVHEPSEGAMLIDLSTIRSLELIQNLIENKSKDCLFGVLNQTVTPMGSRLVRANLLQPLTEKRKIEKRFDAIEDFLGHEEIFSAVRKGKTPTRPLSIGAYCGAALKGFLDIDKVLSEMVIISTRSTIRSVEQSINNILQLKQCLRSVPSTFEALTGAQSELLRQIRHVVQSS